VPYRSLRLRPGVGSPRLARRAVLGWLRELEMEALAERALLIVSELVANAAVHAHTVLELSMTANSRSLKLSVRDEDERLPVFGGVDSSERHLDNGPSSLGEGGRGMVIVQGLADEWGVDVLRGGKRVWARISLPPRVRRSSPRRA
jgi:anti-sigma regulatory factor (Ser/Thr protein kinase)